MRIVHVLTRLLRAGSEENTLLAAAGQMVEGHEVVLLHGRDVLAENARRLAPGAVFVEAPHLVRDLDPARDAAALGELRRAIRRLQPDVVHTHQSKAGVLGRAAAAMERVPLVIHGVHILPFLGVGPVKRRLYLASERSAGRVTHGFIHVSEGMKAACLAHGIGVGRPHHVVRSGFDLARFAGAEPAEELRSDGSGGDGRVTLAMLAAFEPRKRHLDLLRQGAGFLLQHPHIRLLLAGEGELEADAASLIRELGLERQVEMLGYRTDPERIIAAADICIHCSEREGLPRSVLQYLAGGRPVLMFDLPGIEEIMANGRNGVLVAQGDWPGFFDRLGTLVSNPAAREALAAGARQTSLGRWDAARMGARTLEIYREIPARDGRFPGGLVIPDFALGGGPDFGPRRIEFFGLPGSGKTTAARELHALLAHDAPALVFSPVPLRDDAAAARRIAAKAGLIARELCRDRDGRRALRRTLAIPQPTLRDTGRSVFTLGSVLSLYRRLERWGQPAVLDQGLLQALWSIRLRALPGRGLDLAGDLLDCAARSTRFHVFVDTPPALCAERLGGRRSKHSRLQRAGALEDTPSWSAADDLCRTLLSELRAHYRTAGLLPAILEVDGRADPAMTARHILRNLEAAATGPSEVRDAARPDPAPPPPAGLGLA